MNPEGNETKQMRNALAISVWENEGGASGRKAWMNNMDGASKWIGPGPSTMSSAAFPRMPAVRP